MSTAEELKNKLRHLFDFEDEYKLGEEVFDVYGKFSQRSARFVAVKKAEIYAFCTYEHIYFKKIDRLDKEYFDSIISYLENHIKSIVNPHEEHMSSIVSLIIECNGLDAELLKPIKKYKFRKSFKWGLEGWAAIKVLVIDRENGEFIESKLAKGDAKKLKLTI